MNVTENTVGGLIKELRGAETQLSLGLDIGVGRERLSRYENGRAKVPSDISRTLVSRFDNPKLALTVQHEYTSTGPIYLNGPNVDLHRCSVREKTIEELQEAIDAIKKTSLSKPKDAINPFEKQLMMDTLEEAVEAQTALANFIAVMTDHMSISYTGVWDSHYQYLQKEGYIK
ncbi:helix-turn-helix transcriptional regulator [Lysinibacillus mangiferihumi]|uniref:Helix-turn-helix transcriptional regulator n=1 Tax=Lysinibacillus mangiferihumi TaxID=1130819 RepID=A0A4U2YZ81_9BACI|nr:helix-turn-helix transcriptional regulator [Lysinibacillus mangiferihumi]TKI65601.1 helix-turn-helix transcriptional regulator [Lysinibacillus mangiferihumi]